MELRARQPDYAAKAYWHSRGALVREDGVKLRREGSPIEGKVRFRYIDREVSLDLLADRSLAGDDAGDTWRVDLAGAFRGLPASKRARMSVAKLQEIAGNIRDALLAWPPAPMSDRAPITDVTFG